jgi:hypothetical protein
MPEKVDHSRFIALLTESFPHVVADIDDCAKGLLHLEMGSFARATQAAIDGQEVETVRRHFQFIDDVFRNAASDVENAVYVSYLENIRFDARKFGLTNPRELLSPRLQQALAELEEHLARISGR